MKRVLTAFVTCALTVLAGCDQARSPDKPAGASMTPATSGHAGMPGMAAPASTSAAPMDARFIDAMIPHHQSAITMATEALTKGEHAEIRTLAQSIVTSQQAEIDQMRAWRSAWYPDLPPTGGMDMPMGKGLSTDASAPFDDRFIDAMIPHHEGAVVMATQARAEAEHAEIKDLAARIIAAQQSEIDEMKKWRAEWFGH